MKISYKQLLPDITTLIFDVDGVLTNGMVTIMPNGELIRQMNVKDGYAIKAAIERGYRICIITGGKNKDVKTRLENLGVTDIYLDSHHKMQQFQAFMEKYNLRAENVLYMGDDIPDLPVMKMVGLPCCPNDATQEVQQIAAYVSNKKGGKGCVRDIIEQIMRVQGKWNNNFNAKV